MLDNSGQNERDNLGGVAIEWGRRRETDNTLGRAALKSVVSGAGVLCVLGSII
ncbi:hypothetical protein X992_6249 [Burkholderia pseudomallei MSHR5492]|nr:hypothetical protein X992_6249 [Burkholderia pseudomallei MSHR5492]